MKNSNVLVIGCEGNADVEIYQKLLSKIKPMKKKQFLD